jgi:hypothetical protein
MGYWYLKVLVLSVNDRLGYRLLIGALDVKYKVVINRLKLGARLFKIYMLSVNSRVYIRHFVTFSSSFFLLNVITLKQSIW